MLKPAIKFLGLLPTKLQEEDKIKHMTWSLGLYIFAQFLWPAYVAFCAVMLLGLVKEFWDERYGSGFCLFDITGNLIGSSAGLLAHLYIKTII